MPRTSIELPGFSHKNPVPGASRIGPFLFSGAITGKDPVTQTYPDGLDDQVANAFHHIRELMEAAGGSTDNIIKLNVHLADSSDREALNREWLQMFPDAASRPARHVMAAQLDGGALINCELVAVFE